MIQLLNKYLGAKKLEAILVALILVGLTLVFKEQITTIFSNIFDSQVNSLVNQILN